MAKKNNNNKNTNTQKPPVDPETQEHPVDPETQEHPVDPETQEHPVDPETQEHPVDPETQEQPVESKPKSARPGYKLVKATGKGFYGNSKIRRGQKFWIPENERMGAWMVLADENMPPDTEMKLRGQASKASVPFNQKNGHLKKDLSTVQFEE